MAKKIVEICDYLLLHLGLTRPAALGADILLISVVILHESILHFGWNLSCLYLLPEITVDCPGDLFFLLREIVLHLFEEVDDCR